MLPDFGLAQFLHASMLPDFVFVLLCVEGALVNALH